MDVVLSIALLNLKLLAPISVGISSFFSGVFKGTPGKKQPGTADLTLPERAAIDFLFSSGFSKSKIAGIINRNRGTVIRYINEETFYDTDSNGTRTSRKNRYRGPDADQKEEARPAARCALKQHSLFSLQLNKSLGGCAHVQFQVI